MTTHGRKRFEGEGLGEVYDLQKTGIERFGVTRKMRYTVVMVKREEGGVPAV